MVTMADVARRAGVSITTVSHVVKGTRRTAPETERAVREAIDSTGYIYDGVAGSLRTGGTRTVGVAMSAITNPYFASLVHALERSLAAVGYSTLLADTHDEPAAEARAMGDLLSRRADAVVLAPSADPTAAMKLARRRAVPVVLIDRFGDYEVDQVGCENVEPTASLVDHLAQIGHPRIAMVAGRRGLPTTEERVEGYRLGLRRNALRFLPSLLVSGESDDAPARAAVSRLLSLRTPPTALIVANNRMTVAAMRALRDHGVRVPQDIALVAFDDFEWADLFAPRLTTIAQPVPEIAAQAVQRILRRLDDPGAPVERTRLPCEFVHRDSCGCGTAASRRRRSRAV